MTTKITSRPPTPAETRAIAALFEERYDRGTAATSRMFAGLMTLQWVAAVAFSIWGSPYAWAGRHHVVHSHVYAAVLLGTVINSLPVALALLRPSAPVTRYVVAGGQMAWSALLIHLTGGRIETHFHVFGSLAFLAFYRDLRVLVPATLVVAADHFLRGMLFPESVYGVANPEWWRFLEHAGWVVFLDVFLVLNCIRSRRELYENCAQQVMLESAQSGRIAAAEAAAAEAARARSEEERRIEMERTNEELAQAYDELRRTQRELVDASRKAGKAEVASNVLHNVGNVLNCVNVSAWAVQETLDGSKVASLGKVVQRFEDSRDDLARFLTEDPMGRRCGELLPMLVDRIAREHATLREEADAIAKCVEHIKRIIVSQQRHGRDAATMESLSLGDVLEEACSFEAFSFEAEGVELVREVEPTPPVETDRHQLLQILVNLLSNARHALRDVGDAVDKRVVCTVCTTDDGPAIRIADNGVGIAEEHLAHLFEHGFTTRPNGNGFGLHASANAAALLGATIRVESDGPGRGATFTLQLVRRRAQAA